MQVPILNARTNLMLSVSQEEEPGSTLFHTLKNDFENLIQLWWEVSLMSCRVKGHFSKKAFLPCHCPTYLVRVNTMMIQYFWKDWRIRSPFSTSPSMLQCAADLGSCVKGQIRAITIGYVCWRPSGKDLGWWRFIRGYREGRPRSVQAIKTTSSWSL